jgi:hypothetical protein
MNEYIQTYKPKVYLATCYTWGKPSDKNPIAKLIKWWRFRRVTKTAAYWLIRGYNIFSPITHSHPIPKFIPARLDTHSHWLGIDFQWIDVCDELWVYCQPGWDESHGVLNEIAYAQKIGKPVRYVLMDMTLTDTIEVE